MAYKKKVEKQISKRQNNKKNNGIKLTSTSSPTLAPLLLNSSTADILAANHSLFNSNNDLNNSINPLSFSKQLLLQQKQQQQEQVMFFEIV